MDLYIFDRELCSKVLKEALLLFLLGLAGNHEQKMFQIEILQGNKNCASEQKSARKQKMCKGTKNVLLWHIMVLNCRVCLIWPCMALYGLVWSVWPSVVLNVMTSFDLV